MFDPPRLADVKARLSDVPNIDQMSLTLIANRMMFGINGIVVGIDPGASDDQIDAAIRGHLEAKATQAALPPQQLTVKPMTASGPGSFAASLKAMLDDAQAGLERARAEGRARVGAAVDKLNDVKAATTKVASGMANQIEGAADAAMSDLGQISNDL